MCFRISNKNTHNRLASPGHDTIKCLQPFTLLSHNLKWPIHQRKGLDFSLSSSHNCIMWLIRIIEWLPNFLHWYLRIGHITWHTYTYQVVWDGDKHTHIQKNGKFPVKSHTHVVLSKHLTTVARLFGRSIERLYFPHRWRQLNMHAQCALTKENKWKKNLRQKPHSSLEMKIKHMCIHLNTHESQERWARVKNPFGLHIVISSSSSFMPRLNSPSITQSHLNRS